MRFTIERLRTLVLAAGVLLVAAILVFLGIGRWKRHFNINDALKPLGANIVQQGNGFEYTQSHGGHTLFKIRASKVVQFSNHQAHLHDVRIELYGEDGGRVDRIEGSEFEYDQDAGTARAAGPVEITLMRPGATAAIAPKPAGGKGAPLATAAGNTSASEIHVRTSGLLFDQKSGVATTTQHVDFSIAQGSGSAMGATYDSQKGHLVLDAQVELNERRGRETVLVHAQHAEFERGDMECDLRAATADYRGGRATAAQAKVLFNEDGSAVRLDATGGMTIETATGAHVAAPRGWLVFNDDSQPRRGRMEGGVVMDSMSQSASGSRRMHESSPSVDLDFSAEGELRHAHLERGVELASAELSQSRGAPLKVSRTWKSPVADVEFRNAAGKTGQVEPASIHGMNGNGERGGVAGVVIDALTQHGKGPELPSKMYADDVTGTFGPDSALTELTGTGHAGIEDTSEAGARQTSTGDRLVAHFAGRAAKPGATQTGAAKSGTAGPAGGSQIETATLDGHVVLTQMPAAKPGAPAPAAMRATAGHADYEAADQLLHLTMSPRVDDGGMQMSADKIDVSQASGDAFAHGNVKATWLGDATGKAARPPAGANAQIAGGAAGLGGAEPSHVIAAEAQMHQANGEATFRGQARLWQGANSVSAPLIVLDRQRQTLVARSTDAADPVRVVLLSAGGVGPADATPKPAAEPAQEPGKVAATGSGTKSRTASVIRVRGADLKYSAAERKAVMRGGAAGGIVTAETGTATTVSNDVELTLLPPATRAGGQGGSPNGGQGGAGRVDQMTARGHVVVTTQGRRGTGEQLVYTSDTGEYVLTGTGAAPPKMTDPARGVVTGEALIFHSRDDSVSIEGGGTRTSTETRAPK